MPPLVSVVMPTYNSERFLKESIESILNQIYRDFEFIIVADSSVDGTDSILDSYQQKDDRIKIYHHERIGLIGSLNKGCRLAKGKYIARMDADDISLPNRLEKQVSYMETHPAIGILGTGLRYIDENGRRGKSIINPTNPKMIGLYLYFENCIAHPSVMMRREVIEPLDFYNSAALHAEDYDLWARSSRITQISNLPEILLYYRIWTGSICQRNASMQNQAVIEIRQSLISRLLSPEISVDAIVTPMDMANSSFIEMIQRIENVAGLMLKLYPAYLKANSLNLKEALEAAYISARFFKSIAKEIIRIKLERSGYHRTI